MRPNLRLHLRPIAGLVSGAVLVAACSSAATPSPASSASAAAPSPGDSRSTVALPSPVDAGAPITVLGTEDFYGDLLGEIGGSRVKATSLLNDPNADPHAFEASPSAAAAVADARLVIVNGLGYDDFVQHLMAASPSSNRVVINVQQLLGLATDANAHIWYEPDTMPRLAAAAQAALARLEPANAAYFAAGERAYVASLAPLTARIAELKAKYAGTPVAFTEPVAGYLATAIGLQVLTPEGFQRAVENGTDPPAADIATERDLLTGHQVRVLLFNSQVITPLTTQIRDLAVTSGVPVVGVAETLPSQYHTYVEWQLAQMDALAQALAKGA